MFTFPRTLATVALATSALAHFHILYPDYRGTNVSEEAGDQTQFCGGLPATATRANFSITNGLIVIDNAHDEGNGEISIQYPDWRDC